MCEYADVQIINDLADDEIAAEAGVYGRFNKENICLNLNYKHHNMTTTAIRERLHGYINEADDKKIMAIFDLFEDQMAPVVDWSEDEEFVAELNDRAYRLEAGIDKGVTIDETYKRKSAALCDKKRSS